jgi:hypothetical protein
MKTLAGPSSARFGSFLICILLARTSGQLYYRTPTSREYLEKEGLTRRWHRPRKAWVMGGGTIGSGVGDTGLTQRSHGHCRCTSRGTETREELCGASCSPLAMRKTGSVSGVQQQSFQAQTSSLANLRRQRRSAEPQARNQRHCVTPSICTGADVASRIMPGLGKRRWSFWNLETAALARHWLTGRTRTRKAVWRSGKFEGGKGRMNAEWREMASSCRWAQRCLGCSE